MSIYTSKSLLLALLMIGLALLFNSCSDTKKKAAKEVAKVTTYPSDVIPFLDECTILLGDGTKSKQLVDFQKNDFFYVVNEDNTNWVVYKSPNVGVTSRTSSNTRSELGQVKHWKPETGGKLTGTLKVKHVSTIGSATKGSSYSVVVGQIHSDDGHENEPLKIYYKKFPGHTKGSVFWNYEINTKGDNSKRWDYSTSVWGYNMSDVGPDSDTALPEPTDGIELNETFSYEINVFNGVMYLTFTSANHETVKFTKSLSDSDFKTYADIPQQILNSKSLQSRGRDGVERANAYADEMQYFKQGAYNQTRAQVQDEDADTNNGSKTVDGIIEKQYANGCYTEVWFKNATLGAGTPPMDQ